MKILQISSTPPLAWGTGGCARVVYGLSGSLAKLGHHVTLATTDMLEPKRRYPVAGKSEIAKGIEIKRFRLLGYWLAWKYKFYLSPGLILYLRDHIAEYDVVHLQDLLSIHAFAARRYCLLHDIPYVLTTHGSASWLSRSKLFNRMITKTIASKVVADASKVTALTVTEAHQLAGLGVPEERIAVVPNGIDTSEYTIPPARGEFRRTAGLSETDQIVLYVGRLHDSKGLDLLVGAFKNVAKEKKDAVLVICGPDDGYEDSLMILVSELGLNNKVVVSGFVSDETRLKAFVDADVFVTPKYSGFPIAFLEACMTGTPIVTTSAGDDLGWIDKKVGFVVGYNEEEIGRAILRILDDDNLKARFAEEEERIVREKFHWDQVVLTVEDLYKSILQGRTG